VRRLVVVAALALAVLGSGMCPATAEPGYLRVDVPGDGYGFTHDPQVPLVLADRLAPGYGVDSTLSVQNSSDTAAALSLGVYDVRDAENGCSRQESRGGLDDCADPRGELSEWLRVMVQREDPAQTVLWSGDFTALASGVRLTDDLPAGATWTLRVTLTLPSEATNETMTDRVSFGSRLVASSAAGSSEVVAAPQQLPEKQAGPQGVEAPYDNQPGPQTQQTPLEQPAQAGALGSSMAPAGRLPATGTELRMWMLLSAAALLLTGVSLSGAARRRGESRVVASSR
jgi:hypothetical protein